MKWEKDWLYGLVIRDIEQIWLRAEQESMAAPGNPAPEYLVVSQFSLLSTRPDEVQRSKLHACFVTPIIEQWIFDAAGMRRGTPAPTTNPVRGTREMFFPVGNVNFGFSTDRKLVLVTYQMGPLYGEVRVFIVKGQGVKGQLEAHPDFIWWRS